MDKLVSVTARLDKDSMGYISKSSKLFHIDRSTAFRILLQRGIKEDKKEKALNLYMEGKISLEGAAKYADLYIGEFLEYMKDKGVESNLTMDDFLASLNNIKA